mmetsp:Transcript_19619/g.57247  ORF Transcript_19619/g.57247 Transcript_19619/m.57247 type:complete len:128 (-) Transcript_19619:113-496(-)
MDSDWEVKDVREGQKFSVATPVCTPFHPITVPLECRLHPLVSIANVAREVKKGRKVAGVYPHVASSEPAEVPMPTCFQILECKTSRLKLVMNGPVEAVAVGVHFMNYEWSWFVCKLGADGFELNFPG